MVEAGTADRRAHPAARGLLGRENRDFLIRTARQLAVKAGLRQFPGIGAELPIMDNVHQVVQRAAADALVACVDHDPDVAGYARELTAGDAMHQYTARTDRALTLRGPEQIMAFSDGLELLVPGLVNVASWRPEPGQRYDESQAGYLGGAGATGHDHRGGSPSPG